MNASGQQIGKWDNSGANITGSLHTNDSGGTCDIEDGVINLTTTVSDRRMISMRRGNDYLSINPTTIFWTDGNISYTKTWKNLLEMLDLYQHDYGESLFETWEGTSTGQPIIKVDPD